MDFFSVYRHGFARVAACTIRSALADPAANAASILRVARDCDARGAAVAVFPELALSAYSIEDLLLQDALLDGVERAAAGIIEASRGLLPCWCWAPDAPRRARVQHGAGRPPRPAARRRAQDLPAELP
jgi:NAD+ synthase (glutamine-hydrolysing)